MEKARFQLLSEDELAILADECNNKNTKRSTNTWLNVYKSWAVERNMKVQLEDYSPLELDVVLCQFYGEIRKKDGNNYEPDSLRVMQAGLHRYLVEKKYPKSIMDDVVFDKSIKTLEGKARLLRQNGMGKRPNASQAITRDEEDELWRCGKLGISNPVSLLHTIWFLNIQHFGQRGQQEHASVTIENFQRKTDESGLVYIEYFEPPTKTRQHGLHPNLRITNPKMFEIPGNEKCPVKIFDFYVSKRPSVLQKTGRFYLSPKSVFSNDVDEPWFKSVPIGKNKIATFMKEIISGTTIEKANKKITNHSGRKTVVKKMKAANIPETSIIKVTGHKTTEGLKSYDPGDQGEFKRMSDTIVIRPESFSAQPSPSLSLQHSRNTGTLSGHPEQVGHVFNNCTVTFNNIIQKNESRKRKRVIYSSESSQSQ